MQKVQTIPRSKILLECLHDGNVLNTGTTGGNGTATNIIYQSTDRGYQTQDGTYGATSQTTFAYGINGIMTLHMRIYPTANTKTIIQYLIGTAVSIDASNNISITGLTSTTVYVNNVQTSALTLNAWNDVCITHATVNATAFIIGVLSYVGKIGVVRLFNGQLSLNEIQSLYMEGLRKLGGSSLVPLTDGLVAYYDFNGDAQDIIGGNTGTITSATLATDMFGTANRCYTISNTGSLVTNKINTNYVINSASNFTIDCWIYNRGFKSGANNESTIFGARSFPNGFFVYLNDSAGATNKMTLAYANNTNAQGTTTLSASTWYHVAMVQNGNTQTVYLNGVAEISSSFTVNSSGIALIIGNASSTLNRQFYGDIADFRVYTIAKSSSEVLALYQISAQRYITPLLF